MSEDILTPLRPGLPPLPDRMRSLPTDARGYPVPWFVAWVDGVPDFRTADARKQYRCVTEHRCWLCGERLGSYLAFVIGPMCAVNRISSEPPSHRACAEFAVQACPFLVRPAAQRREANLPTEAIPAAGHTIARNPGVALVWITRGYTVVEAPGGVLFHVGEPVEVHAWAEGRAATPEEVHESVRTGLPSLQALALAEDADADRSWHGGRAEHDAVRTLGRQLLAACQVLAISPDGLMAP